MDFPQKFCHSIKISPSGLNSGSGGLYWFHFPWRVKESPDTVGNSVVDKLNNTVNALGSIREIFGVSQVFL